MPRPIVHFTAERGWINDPHGLTFRDGEYHLFHQYVPDRLEWAPHCHWGHAVSRDLLTWEARPVALAPGDGDDGIWTGSLVDSAAGARILYTSVASPDLGLGRIRVATALDDDWDTWSKGEVVARAPADLDLLAYRDPFVVREGDGWRMFVGAATRGGEALALTYTSEDLSSWAYDGVAASRSTSLVEPVWMGALWECPQVFEVDGHWLMVSSVWDGDVLHYAGYGLGTYAAGRFTATVWGRLSFGESYYAPSFFRDSEGRPCVIFWMRGVGDADAGWAGCLSVPYLLSVDGERLVAQPHPAVTGARAEEPGRAARGALTAVVDLEWDPAPDGDRLVLLSSGTPSATITVAAGSATLDRPGHGAWSMPHTGGPLRVLVDGPVLEVSTRDGLLGGAIRPAEEVLPVRGGCSAWSLAERAAPG